MAYVQATLAFGHYKANERIESLLLRKCYDAALAEVQQLKNLQLALLSDNSARLKTTQSWWNTLRSVIPSCWKSYWRDGYRS